MSSQQRVTKTSHKKPLEATKIFHCQRVSFTGVDCPKRGNTLLKTLEIHGVKHLIFTFTRLICKQSDYRELTLAMDRSNLLHHL